LYPAGVPGVAELRKFAVDERKRSMNEKGGAVLMRFINAAFGLVAAPASFPAAGQPPPLSVAPQLVLSTNYVGAVIAATNPTQVVEAYNVGASALNLTFTASASWLSASVGALRACTTRSGNLLPDHHLV
jgi:hypothetical protein